jgi:hypothetical protein
VFGEFWFRVIFFVFSGSYMCPFSADELHQKLTGGRVPLWMLTRTRLSACWESSFLFSGIEGEGVNESKKIISDTYTLGACLQHASFLSFMKVNL